MIASGRRFFVILGGAIVLVFLVLTARRLPFDYEQTWQSAKQRIPGLGGQPGHDTAVAPHVANYFEQVFSADEPSHFDFAALSDACSRVEWNEDDIYMRCGGMSAGMFSIVSQVKVCLKMAIDTGSHLVLPSMPLRDSEHLLEYNRMNTSAYLTYDQWFDAEHIKASMARACPKMRVVHPSELDTTLPVKKTFSVSCQDAWNYRYVHSYFWVGRPYATFFADQLRFKKGEFEADKADPAHARTGVTVVDVDSEFLLFRITDDPTHRDLRTWTDLSHLVRFNAAPRQIIHRLLGALDSPARPYYGVHFRVENDSIWSSLDAQLHRDLDGLEQAWVLDGKPEPRPPVYLACGDAEQVEKFVAAGGERGWLVTHKWRLSEGDHALQDLINSLAFDFQGAIDMGIMIRARWFFGIGGSAFSSTVANHRDKLGRYRGNSFIIGDDDGARNVVFNDLDADEYACCL
jgi:hypothetical protein